MMFKKSVLMIVPAMLLTLSTESLAQNTDDAIRYSQTITGGTALSAGMGGAVGALGGDYSVASVNPAGLGLYRRSEFGGTLGFFNASGNSTYYGTSDDDRKFNFNIPNFHLVINTPNPNRLKTKGWLSTTFAFGYNKQNNLGEYWRFRGNNTDSSIVNAFLKDAGTATPDNLNPFSSGLAYQTYLIDPNQTTGGYTSLNVPLGNEYNQTAVMDARGRLGETNIAFSGNYSNRLYVGGAIAIRRLVYEREYSFIERDLLDSAANYDQLQYRQTQEDRGTSFALRGGAIYRVNDFLRLGASALLPLDYTIRTTYTGSIDSEVANGTHFYEANGEYRYKLRQPARFTGSATFIYEKLAILSVDYELVDYSRLRLNDDSDSFLDQNDRIRSEMKNTGNLRAGIEFRFSDLYARGGYQLTGSPYVNDNFGKPIQQYSLGFGYRNEAFFFDIAYTMSKRDIIYFPYSYAGSTNKPANIQVNSNQLLLSIGTRF